MERSVRALVRTGFVGVLLLAAALAGMSSRAESPPAPGFGVNVRVTDGLSPFLHQVEPSLAVDAQGRLFVGWKEAETPDGVGLRVGFAKSLDGGATWSPNILMDRLYRFQTDPWLALDDQDRLYYGRLEFAESTFQNQGVAVSRSDDGGATWGPITDADDLRQAFVDKSSIVTDGSTVYVGWTAVAPMGRTIDVGIRVAGSTDGGTSWSSSVRISDSLPTANPLGAVLVGRAGGVAHAAWWDAGSGNVLADRSFDGGRTWGIDVRVNPVPGSASGSTTNMWAQPLPSIGMTSRGTLFIAWAEGAESDLDIFVARSTDGGLTWSTPARANDDASGQGQWQPALAIGPDDTIHLAWLDKRTGSYDVFYATSRDGRRWSTNVRVTDAQTSAFFTRPGDYLGLAVDVAGTAYAVWTDGRSGDFDIYFARRPGVASATSALPVAGDLLIAGLARAVRGDRAIPSPRDFAPARASPVPAASRS